jgi:RNA polymerase sigma factor (sigma-70 family)
VAELDENVLRHESGRLLATLVRVVGVGNLALAEDAVQDTLAQAIEAWTFAGVPEHYSALLMTAAKHRAIDLLRRQRTARRLAPELGRWLESEWTLRPAVEELFLPAALRDDELRMMFSCCQPSLDEDVQVALILKLLCGFGVGEIASAFLVSVAAVEKRLTRGKAKLAESTKLFELSAADVALRLSTVHRALYLLFNEGYHSACADRVIRADLCEEALRLVRLLIDHPPAAMPATYALAALMYLDAARLPGRLDAAGNLVALFKNDRSRWDAALISEGMRLLQGSGTGTEVTDYHLEAGIAACHAAAGRAEETRWAEIVSLYDALMRVRPSPVVALNRAIAVAEWSGPRQGLAAIRDITDQTKLASYPFYWAAIGELELRAEDPVSAREHFGRARELARNDEERRFVDQRLASCERAARS